MRAVFVSLAIAALIGASAPAQSLRLPAVTERPLRNGLRVLVVERPGTGAVRVQVFIKGGRANTGGLPPVAADLLGRSLFDRALPDPVARKLEPLLDQEEGAFEALRLERLARARVGQDATLSPSPDRQSLKALDDRAMADLDGQIGGLETWDALDALGATGRSLVVTADYVSYGMDLPAAAVASWMQVEAARLRGLALGRFPLERDRLLQEIESGTPPSPPSLSVLLATALSGRPYGLAGEFHRSQVEAMGWRELQTYARWAVSPENTTLVLVGDVKAASVFDTLESAFGSLPRATASEAHWQGVPVFQAEDPVSSLESPGGRRLLVSTTGDTRVLFGWRIPPANHPDGAALRALVQILGGAPSARLSQDLVTSKGLARRVSVQMGVPGRRDVNLLVIEAEPAPGHSLDELEQAIEDEVLRLQLEPLSDLEVRQAQTQLEAAEVRAQEDAGTLALNLGAAQCQGGDWRMAFRALETGGNLKPVELQRVARSYLVPPRMTLVMLGPDPLLVPLDRTESRLLQVLTALLRPRLGESAQAQSILREALRQLRMLTPAEREQTLKLLESQVQK